MTVRVHGSVFRDDIVTGNYDYFTVRTTVDIRPSGLSAEVFELGADQELTFPLTVTNRTFLDVETETFANEAEYVAGRNRQRAFDALINTVSTRAQPILIGRVVTEAAQTPPISDLPGAGASGDPDVDVYVVKFAIEHTQVWEAEDLAVALDGLGVSLDAAGDEVADTGFVFSVGVTTDNNVAVVKNDYLV